MTRYVWIERCLRQIYNGQPDDDATITYGLVNVWLNTAIGMAAKANYKDNITIDGIGYVNNSFYTKFSDIAIKPYENLKWKIELPEIPLGIGTSNGVSTLELFDPTSRQVSRPFIPLSQNQKTYFESLQPPPNKILYYSEGKFLYASSTLLLNLYTANVTMISGGDSTDLYSELNVPADYDNVMIEYIKQQLLLEKAQPLDNTNDGEDFITTT